MKKTLILPDTISACHKLILQQAALIERLQGRALGGLLKDRAVKYDGPSLFEEYDEEARLAAAKELEKASKDVDAAAQKRRDETAQQSKGQGKRPEKCNTYALLYTVTTINWMEGWDINGARGER